MNGALAIFVKTPGLSPVKTRLAADLTTQAAERFYRLAVQATTEVVQQLAQSVSITPYYAVAEQQAMSVWPEFPVVWQGEGGLGERMDNIYRYLLSRYDYVLLIGSDIPQMSPEHLQRAIIALQNDKMVIAPSEDGGFWLFGGSCRLPASVWTTVHYSQKDTLEQFVANLSAFAEIQLLDKLQDIDDVSDLKPLQQSLAALRHPTPAQRQLLSFLLHRDVSSKSISLSY